MIRKLVVLTALIIAAAAFLTFTEPGHRVLSAFGVPAPECAEARFLGSLGFQVPQCTCGHCSSSG